MRTDDFAQVSAIDALLAEVEEIDCEKEGKKIKRMILECVEENDGQPLRGKRREREVSLIKGTVPDREKTFKFGK